MAVLALGEHVKICSKFSADGDQNLHHLSKGICDPRIDKDHCSSGVKRHFDDKGQKMIQ